MSAHNHTVAHLERAVSVAAMEYIDALDSGVNVEDKLHALRATVRALRGVQP